MNSFITFPPATVFSSCSEDDLNDLISDGDDFCLFNDPGPPLGGPQCGNGFVEEEEECDCGGPQQCADPCCNATSCLLFTEPGCTDGAYKNDKVVSLYCFN